MTDADKKYLESRGWDTSKYPYQPPKAVGVIMYLSVECQELSQHREVELQAALDKYAKIAFNGKLNEYIMGALDAYIDADADADTERKARINS